MSLIKSWSSATSYFKPSHSASLKFYTSLKVPVNVVAAMPKFQIQYGPTATLPFTNASNFGILGLEKDLLLITDGTFDGKKVCRATTMSNVILGDIQVDVPLSQPTTLKFLTWFEAIELNFYSGHLEQLAIACPNLQQLNLQGNSHCLKRLQGLRSIARNCRNLQGLNLLGISVDNVQNKLQFWKILSHIKLTHLCVGFCLLRCNPFAKKRMSRLYLLRSVLRALEVQVHEDSSTMSCSKCGYYEKFSTEGLKKVSHFPMLDYCKLSQFDLHPSMVHNLVSRCDGLSSLIIHCDQRFALSREISMLAHNRNLKHLCLSSYWAVVSKGFMEAVSAHGGLEHVILMVYRITFSGIIALVKNSPMLIMFRASVAEALKQDGIPDLKVLKQTLMETFPCRKLFTIGSYLVQEHFQDDLSYDLLIGTDFKLSLWPL